MLAVSEQGTQVDKDWREAPLKSLVEHLVRDHRSWRAKDFPLIQELFDRIEGNRISESLQAAAIEAELVIDARAVEEDRVVAIVLSNRRDHLVVTISNRLAEGYEGIGSRHVTNRAFRGGLCLETV